MKNPYDELDSVNPYDQLDIPSAPVQAPTDNVPGWGMRNPNLYGLYGAGMSIAKPALEFGGMLAGGVAGAPAGPAGVVAGGALGYTGGNLISNYLQEKGGERPVPDMLGRVQQTGQAFTEGALMEMTGQSANKLLNLVDPAMRLYKSAVKPGVPTKRFSLQEQRKALQAGLDEGIYPTEKGAQKLDKIVEELNDTIMGKITEGSKAGAKIKTSDVVERLKAAEEHFKRVPESDTYLEQIDKIRKGVEKKGTEISLLEAQKTKQDIGALLRKEYGKLGSATVEANKQIVRGYKEEILEIFPELNKLNNKEAQLLRLEPLIERAAGRINQRDLMGIGTPIAGVAGSTAMGPAAGKTAFIAKAIFDHPNVKTFLAILLNKVNKGGVGAGVMDARIAAYYANKLRQEQEQPVEPLPF